MTRILPLCYLKVFSTEKNIFIKLKRSRKRRKNRATLLDPLRFISLNAVYGPPTRHVLEIDFAFNGGPYRRRVFEKGILRTAKQ